MKFHILLLTLLLQLSSPFKVFAHTTEPRLEISIDRIIPGGVIDLRGVAFDYEEVVTLTLIGAQSELPFGEVIADTEGIFLYIVTLPTDLAEGTYHFRAVTSHHYAISPALLVQGKAIPAEGEGGEERWEEEEYLPYAIPTYPPGVIPGAVPGATPAGTGESEDPGVNIPMVAVSGFILLSGVLLFMIQRRRIR